MFSRLKGCLPTLPSPYSVEELEPLLETHLYTLKKRACLSHTQCPASSRTSGRSTRWTAAPPASPWSAGSSAGRSACLASASSSTRRVDGTSLRGIAAGAEAVGLAALTSGRRRAGVDQLPLPAIFHWEGNHWVVLFEVDGDQRAPRRSRPRPAHACRARSSRRSGRATRRSWPTAPAFEEIAGGQVRLRWLLAVLPPVPARARRGARPGAARRRAPDGCCRSSRRSSSTTRFPTETWQLLPDRPRRRCSRCSSLMVAADACPALHPEPIARCASTRRRSTSSPGRLLAPADELLRPRGGPATSSGASRACGRSGDRSSHSGVDGLTAGRPARRRALPDVRLLPGCSRSSSLPRRRSTRG